MQWQDISGFDCLLWATGRRRHTHAVRLHCCFREDTRQYLSDTSPELSTGDDAIWQSCSGKNVEKIVVNGVKELTWRMLNTSSQRLSLVKAHVVWS